MPRHYQYESLDYCFLFHICLCPIGLKVLNLFTKQINLFFKNLCKETKHESNSTKTTTMSYFLFIPHTHNLLLDIFTSTTTYKYMILFNLSRTPNSLISRFTNIKTLISSSHSFLQLRKPQITRRFKVQIL
jgi:hypothetical protein